MLRNYLAATLRNFARNRLFSAISVFGLGIGLCGALLSVLVVRDQLTQGRFIAGHEHLYQVVAMTQAAGQPAEWSRSVDVRVAALLEQHGAARDASRLSFENGGLQNGAKGADEFIYWVDANFFDLVRLRVLDGDLATALRRPDGLVLDRSAARRYFGRDDAVGATLQLRSAATRALHPMRVTAVIEDLPAVDTTFQSGIFASGLAPFSPLAQANAAPGAVGSSSASVRTYVRMESAAAAGNLGTVLREVAAALPARTDAARTSLELVRIDRLNLHAGLMPGFMVKIAMMLLMGAIIVLVAAVNFVNLMTARASQRSLEVGIRKAAGATRVVLVLQFLAEAFLYALLGTVLAIALTEWLLPHVNSFLNGGAEFNYWRDPRLAAGLLATPLVLALLAGAWPAQVLSSFRPGVASAGIRVRSQGNLLRQILVTTQFALLIALMIAAGVVFQQRHFALNQALRVNTDQMLMMWAPCREGFLNDLRAIPGLRGFACGGWQWLNEDPTRSAVHARDGSQQNLWVVPVDLAAFDLYGLAPLAGRLTLDAAGREYPRDASRYVINESAAHRLGFRNVQEAVGQQIDIPPAAPGSTGGHVIIGVVPDFSLVSVEKVIKPTAYLFEPSQQYLVSVKLAAQDIPATLAAIDRAWAATGAKEPANRFFLDARLEQMYLSLLRQAQAFGVIALATLVLAVFGLFGLAAAAVARRTREIGIRKALGAQTSDVLRLLLWQFGKPVLWANCIAWPLAGWAMRRWLDGFAYHIALPLWMFPAAALLALLIALATVGAHALRVASAKPVVALRHE